MIIQLEELKNTPGQKMALEFNEFIAELNNSVDVIGHVMVEMTLYGVKVKGSVSTSLDLTCDRCLKTFPKPINVDFDEDFLYGTLVPDGVKEHELKSGEFVGELRGEEAIDITDIVYQTIVLEEPTQTLCSKTCKGSKELQELLHEETVDPRLQKFKDINL